MLDCCLTCLSKSKETVHQCQVCQFAFGNPAQISVSSFFHKMCKVITEFISYWIRLSLQEEPQKWRLIHTTHCGWVPFMNPLSARFPTVARMEHLTMNGRVFFHCLHWQQHLLCGNDCGCDNNAGDPQHLRADTSIQQNWIEMKLTSRNPVIPQNRASPFFHSNRPGLTGNCWWQIFVIRPHCGWQRCR